MKIRLIFSLVIVVLSIQISFPWGGKGHRLINRKAVEFLPAEMNDFKKWADYISDHSEDPDIRRNDDKSEFPKHFIDIDYYKEFLNGKMIYDKAELTEVYNDSIVTAMGILPWATLATFENLTNAFREGNRDKVLIFASDLGHYVGDGHQPMHTILNYDGQLSGQKGIHGRYESEMVNNFIDEIENSLDSSDAEFIGEPIEFIFNYISNSNSMAEVLFAADELANNSAGNKSGDEYYRLLWFRTNYVTKIQFNEAVADLSSLIYTAWINAGRPPLTEIN